MLLLYRLNTVNGSSVQPVLFHLEADASAWILQDGLGVMFYFTLNITWNVDY